MEYSTTLEQSIYDAGNDVHGKFPEEFRKYIKNEKLLCWPCWNWEFSWVGTDFWVFQKAHTPDDGVTLECRRLVDRLINFFKRDDFHEWRFLVQFWVAEEVVKSVDDISDEINYRLTTCNQPFLLGDMWISRPVHEGLCRYRMKTCDVIVTGDGGGGVIRRVFQNKRIEYTSDVGHSSANNYPHRDVALSCDIRNSIVVPWFDSYGKVVGVIEFVSPRNPLCSFTKVVEYFDEYVSFSQREKERNMEIYDGGKDVDGRFAEEFRKYVRDENLLCMRWRHSFSYRTLFWVFENEPQRDSVTSDIHIIYRRLTDTMRVLLKTDYSLPGKSLVQFWKAEEASNSINDFEGERSFILTTRNQPFMLWDHSLMYDHEQISEGICSYRMKTCDVIITRGRGGGAIGRVFRYKKMEVTPDVAYYSSEEYPHRDMALSFLIKGSLIIPFFDSFGNSVGVIEVVSQSEQLLYFMDKLLSIMPGKDCGKGLCGQYDIEKNLLRSTVSEIKEVMEVIYENFDLDFAQTWMLCKDCNSLSTTKRCAEELSASYGGCFFDEKNPFLEVGCYCLLIKGEGIVGKAVTSSHNLVYCNDVAKLSITEYPLSHFARKYHLSSCFAICLRASHTGDHIYVLEFFLSPSYGEGGNLSATLVPILDILRKHFQTLKVAYGNEEIEDSLSVQVIDANSPDKVETLEKGTIHLTGADNVKASYRERGESSRPYYLQRSIGESSRSETDDSMIGPETSVRDYSIEEISMSSPSTIQSEFHVTIKANYEDVFIWIPLSASSGIDDLKQQVSHGLKLMEGTYELNYLDEDNDPVLLTCDEDLQHYISSLIKRENYSSMVFIEPKRT